MPGRTATSEAVFDSILSCVSHSIRFTTIIMCKKKTFLERVNDQVRKRQKRSSMNVTENDEKHSVIWRMFMSVTLESAVFMGKNYLNNCQSIANTIDLTLKQMFDISTRLVSEQDEISGLETIGWENHSWKYMSLIGDERVLSIFNARRSTSFQILYCVLVRSSKTPNRTMHGKTDWEWFKSFPVYRNFDRVDGEPMEFEWNMFPGFNTLQLSEEVKHLLLRLDETPENFTGRIIFMSMFNDISCGSKDNKKECESNAQLVSLLAKRFGAGQWSFLGPGSEKKWFSISEDSSQGEWEKIAHLMMITCKESGHPVFRATSPLSRGVIKSKGGGKLSIHFCAEQETITTVFRRITSVNQLSLYGAVADMCEEYESFHDRTGQPVVEGQSSSSFVPSVIKTNVSLNNDDPAHQEFLLQRYGERIEKVS